ncbi:hypothetical protein Kpol_461p13 [Vanderwaltozyma polyspora DSM 70294]|uniref:DNA-directed RNA polymerase III subunit RPC4 n=1 Tax=Vanderwaltozyma polyspora (strain ATCC 22028 / DSM 70294 / BCRC 21397 / CBS 2163 / NBRC 10782 / NRRL Y-8283 / UCD 57-17) TaxID=436907 RepID=A7TR49_VANPO|nr:uncharacterized protein Kpol_461p13 [Vanderwaltozyma polyspora DSM 70294]EDO15259.1 hypothetical protein Kpol_461p13 [Vanderwaltozyma polyspora DSM 70294]
MSSGSGSGSGRLPSLSSGSGSGSGSGAGKPSLKFKPKAVARRTKEERDASAPKVNEEANSHNNDKKKPGMNRKPGGQQQRRVPKYLANTHVITSGPLAAGNFTGGGKDMMRRNFAKSDTYANSMNKGDDEDALVSGINKINMGKEYSIKNSSESDSTEESSENEGFANSMGELFPITPLRIKHEDVDGLQREITTETLHEEPAPVPTPVAEETPAVEKSVKIETDATGLNETLEARETLLKEKLKLKSKHVELEPSDPMGLQSENKTMNDDYEYISNKLVSLEKDAYKYLLFQLPPKLPMFTDETETKSEETEGQDVEMKEQEEANEDEEVEGEEKTTEAKTSEEKSTKPAKPEIIKLETSNPTGKIGFVRIHRSGKMTVKIGKVVMDIGKSAEATFLQELVALDDSEESPSVRVLGQVEGRVVVTPKLEL